ncbi:hypothetical protein SKTS_13600 [Sulfurimicrobium lacus]|uniref:Uncharacterized protein n=1 Tax=Sulfurimicrobium lacus TaxID=2715678 RepID=A0A6F8V9Y8_9PROT|nr:phage protein Gp37 [Sulfurimicrobium lacus]BCB26474.1 hypothetical protein SKTS_13600 [Sulfurimicrobium lacus]
MFAELEAGLVRLVKSSAIGPFLKAVGTLPDDDEDNLVNRMAADAPAVYVVAGRNFKVEGGRLVVPFGLTCMARNSRGHEDARRGDGKALGMYQILEAVLGLAENGWAGGCYWRVSDVGFLNSDKIWKAGLTVGVVTVETTVAMPSGIDLAALSDFKTFHADYDIPPIETAAEHNKWKQEPADYSASKPELQDTIIIQP